MVEWDAGDVIRGGLNVIRRVLFPPVLPGRGSDPPGKRHDNQAGGQTAGGLSFGTGAPAFRPPSVIEAL
jgi:hypothetical protein